MALGEPLPLQDLAARTSNIISWLRLNAVPTSAQVDTSGKLGLQDAFRMHEGIYPDPVPVGVINEAKAQVTVGNSYAAKEIPILEESKVKDTRVPIFREQVQSAAQYLARIGVEPSKPIVFDNPIDQGVIETKPYNFKAYETNDPNMRVIVTRDGSTDDAQVTRIVLSLHK